jgi:N-methylhydantoinase A
MLTLMGEIAEPIGSRPIFDPARAEMLESRIYERTELPAGALLTGPAVIAERETTTIITSSFDAVIQSEGSILLIRKGARP